MTITILGPTATGKTRIAAMLAKHIGGEIISADSRQVYCGMDIGTGKDLADYTIDGISIPYHLIDIVKPGIEYNVFQYQQLAHQAIRDIEERGKQVVICGGSGMYIEALLKGYKLFPVPDNPSLRAELEKQTDEQLTELLASFKALHNHTDTCERPRLLRAIEIEVYYREHPELWESCRAVPSVVFGLRGDRDLIRSRITRRLRDRLETGMVEEVRNLIAGGVSQQQLIRYGLEYKFLTLYLQGQMDYDTMFERLKIAIHQFSKRQMTWFRKMERDGFNIHWMDVEWPEEDKLSFILRTCNL